MSSMLDSLKEQITPDVIRGLASSLGESGDAVQKGLLGGATTKSGYAQCTSQGGTNVIHGAQ